MNIYYRTDILKLKVAQVRLSAKVGLPLGFLKIGANAFTKYKEGKKDEVGEQIAIEWGWRAFHKYLSNKIIKKGK